MEIPIDDDSEEGMVLEKADDSWRVNNGFAGMLYRNPETGDEFYVSYKSEMYRKKNSWAVSSSIIGDLEDKGVQNILVVDTNEGDIYHHRVQDYLNAETIDHPGYDKQQAPDKKEAEFYENALGPQARKETYPDKIEF